MKSCRVRGTIAVHARGCLATKPVPFFLPPCLISYFNPQTPELELLALPLGSSHLHTMIFVLDGGRVSLLPRDGVHG